MNSDIGYEVEMKLEAEHHRNMLEECKCPEATKMEYIRHNFMVDVINKKHEDYIAAAIEAHYFDNSISYSQQIEHELEL